MDSALIYNPNALDDFIGHSAVEHPLVVQLGGCDPDRLAEAAALCEQYAPFHEINLNCGCPSNKAKRAGFGAELMLEPDRVAASLRAMSRRLSRTDLSVKCRLGVTGREAWDDLVGFVRCVSDTGVRHLVVHARSCVLKVWVVLMPCLVVVCLSVASVYAYFPCFRHIYYCLIHSLRLTALSVFLRV